MIEVRELVAVFVTRVVTSEQCDMRLGRARRIAVQTIQHRNQRAVPDLPLGIHIRNVVDDQVATGSDLQFIAVINKPLQVGAMIYQLL